MDNLAVDPPLSAATTERQERAEAEDNEHLPLSTQTTLPVDVTQYQSTSTSPSTTVASNQSRRTSKAWSIIKLPPASTFNSLVPKSLGFLGRYKTIIYKNSLKILVVFCGIATLVLAWKALNSPTNPNDIDIQLLAVMNRSVSSQIATYKVLQESLLKLQEEVANGRRQLQLERESLLRQKSHLDLERWTAQRQFIRDCLEFQEVSSCRVVDKKRRSTNTPQGEKHDEHKLY